MLYRAIKLPGTRLGSVKNTRLEKCSSINFRKRVMLDLYSTRKVKTREYPSILEILKHLKSLQLTFEYLSYFGSTKVAVKWVLIENKLKWAQNLLLKVIQFSTLYYRALLEHYSSIIILTSTRTEKWLLARYSLEYFLKMLVLARTRKFDTRYSTITCPSSDPIF